MKLDVSNALSHPGQEYPFSGLQAIADQEIGGDTVRIDECAVEGTFLSDEDGNISVRGTNKKNGSPVLSSLQQRRLQSTLPISFYSKTNRMTMIQPTK